MAVPIYEVVLKSIHPDGMGGLDYHAYFGDEAIEGTITDIKGKVTIKGFVKIHGRIRTQTKDALKDAETASGIAQIDIMHIRIGAELAQEEEKKPK